jgi:hypothetical protein
VAVRLTGARAGEVLVGSGGEVVELTRELASHVFVDADVSVQPDRATH